LEKIGHFLFYYYCKSDPKSAFFGGEKSPNFQNQKTEKKAKKKLVVSAENAFREGTILLLSRFISNGMFAIS
jgi:hypothetical protein